MKVIAVKRWDPNRRRDLTELIELSEAAGYTVVGTLEQVREEDSRFNIGPGKARELAVLVKRCKADKVIFGNELKPVQEYQLAKLTGVENADRFRLILEIFARRAASREAKLQIKLAYLRYELVRAREKVRLARLGEQPGFRGLGKYEVDVYYESIRRQIHRIERLLAELRRKRAIRWQRYLSPYFSTVSLAGYTNAGKSTLFTALTGREAPVGPEPFTTISAKSRLAKFADKKAILIDTVGFIRDLPLALIESFRATLEETIYADVILLVVDVNEPKPAVLEKLDCCIGTLKSIKAWHDSVVTAVNKIDLLSQPDLERKLRAIKRVAPNPVPVSALYEINLEELKWMISSLLPGYVGASLKLPLKSTASASLLSEIYHYAEVLERRQLADWLHVTFVTRKPFLNKVLAKAGRLRSNVETRVRLDGI